uniref:TcaA 3rd/4th domain-containing protein n=1 Tax=uncultured Clostridium sp. TaxID=59620 RepID=UPI00272E9A1B
MKNFKEMIKSNYNLFIEYVKYIKGKEFKSLFKERKLELSIISVVIFVILIFLFSSFTLSKEKLLKKFELALINGNSNSLAKCVKLEDKDIASKELKPLIDGYDKNKLRINKIVNEIRRNGESENFKLKIKKGFLYDKYYIDINTINVKFTTNISDVNVEFLNKRFNLINEAEFNIIPGEYSLSYKYKTKYGDISESKIINLMEDKIVEVNIDANYITVYSNYDDAKVFINNVDTGLISKEIKNYGPLPKDKDIKVFIQREFPWGIIKSEEISIGNNQYINLNIDMVNDRLNNMINETVDSFYSSVFNALNNKDKNLISGSIELVKEVVYNYMNEKAFLFSNSYEISDLAVEIEKSDFKYEEGIYKASLLTKVEYSVYKKIFPFAKNYKVPIDDS